MAIRVTADARRQIRGGHPWLFDGSITEQSHDGAAGDLAVIFDDKRKFVAIGLYDPASPIRVRILHTGSPTSIDGDFWRSRVLAAAAIRSELGKDTTGYRLVNGENDGFGGLVVDRYGSVLVVKLYSSAWWPHLAEVVAALVSVEGVGQVVLRLARNVAGTGSAFGLHDGQVLVGQVSDPVQFRENGLTFEAATLAGQKTGHFLDQRDNRRRVSQVAQGRAMLDLFSCTGGFSVHAAAGGAASVHLVDLNPHALETARRNLALNSPGAPDCEIETTIGDAFDVLQTLLDRRRRYGLVVVDPPSFAQRRDQVPGALRAYRRLTDLAVRLVEPGGWFVQASCSSRVEESAFVQAVTDAAAGARHPLRNLTVTGHGIDHPVTFAEGGYLKAVFGQV